MFRIDPERYDMDETEEAALLARGFKALLLLDPVKLTNAVAVLEQEAGLLLGGLQKHQQGLSGSDVGPEVPSDDCEDFW